MNKNNVFQYLEQHKMQLAEMIGDLIRIDSQNQGMPDTAEEWDAQAFVFDRMAELGLDPQRLAFDKKERRPNVYGTLRGSGGGKSLLLNAHIDTVCVTNPEQWSFPPLGGLIRDGKVLGRGASDDKMAVAAMIFAAKALAACGVGLRGDVYLLSSVGEESGEGGTVGAGPAAARMPKADFAVVSEATCMEMDVASSSMTYFELIVPGKGAHTCGRNQMLFPQMHDVPSGNAVGVDALAKALPIIESLYRLERDWCVNNKYPVWGAGGIPHYDKKGLGVFTMNPSIIEGGGYLMSTMDSVKITYNLYYPASMSLAEIGDEIRRHVSAVAQTDSWLRENPPIVNMPVHSDWPGFQTDLNDPGVKALQSAFKNALNRDVVITANKSVMDTSFIALQGIPTVALGPGGNDSNQHGVDEWCSIDEVLDAVKVYVCMMMDWCEVNES